MRVDDQSLLYTLILFRFLRLRSTVTSRYKPNGNSDDPELAYFIL